MDAIQRPVYMRSGRAGRQKQKDSEEHPYLPLVTLSASEETGQAELNLPVLKQQSYTGRVLPSAVANIPCAALGVDGMLEKLNAPVRTPCSPPYRACEYFIAHNYDLGTAYAHMRIEPNYSITDRDVTEARKSDEKMRQDLLEKRQVEEMAEDKKRQVEEMARGKKRRFEEMEKDKKRQFSTRAPPRRVWDLYANRVMPYWVARRHPWAISHAWVDDKDLKREMTPINGYEWSVPMPKNADLNLIRIEMLNLGAEYIWLDVLCLRQEGQGEDPRGNPSQEEWKDREALRKTEWKVDLPTIGWVYAQVHPRIHPQDRKVSPVCYFSGLGLPLSFRMASHFEDNRCWFNRAWTLQETPHSPIIAGKTCDDGKIDEKFMPVDMQRRFDKQLASLQHWQPQKTASIFDVLFHMRKRKATKHVDKVAGLVYLSLRKK